MSNRKKIAIWIVIWLVCGAFNYTAGFAELYGKDANNGPTYAQDKCRESAAFAAGFGITAGPIGTWILLFATSFYEHGFKYSCEVQP